MSVRRLELFLQQTMEAIILPQLSETSETMLMQLHGYFRSSASYRVRIALNLKGVRYSQLFHHLRRNEQNDPAYLRLNPQGLLPSLQHADGVLTQSLAICEYLDETITDPPLLPADAKLRARVRAFAQVIACDIHPLQNLKILSRLREYGLDQDKVSQWAGIAIDEGLAACEKLLDGRSNLFCFEDRPGLADICLIPQMVNARRFGVDIRWPKLVDIEARCLALPAFAAAAPENQPDAE